MNTQLQPKSDSERIKQMLDNLEGQIRSVEKTHLTWWERVKKRWTTKEVIVAYQVSNYLTIFQLLALKKIWGWMVAKFPWLGAAVAALWDSVSDFFTALWVTIAHT